MITDGRIHANLIRQRMWHLAGAAVYATVVVLLYTRGHEWIDSPVSIPAMLGTALSILLGFRTASSYDRWWEARKIWGAIVNDSRTFTRQVLTLVLREDGSSPEALHRELVYRQIAWAHVLSRSLRRQTPLTDVDSFLSREEIDALHDKVNISNALLQTQGEQLREAYRQGLLNRLFLVALEDTLKRLTDHMGMCERIKSTVFPGHYSFFISRTLLVFFLLLPAGLVPYLGWLTIPVALVIEMLFSTIEAAGIILQDPFENRSTDTPMTALSRTIEIDLRQQLGEKELPEKLQPVDGVLM